MLLEPKLVPFFSDAVPSGSHFDGAIWQSGFCLHPVIHDNLQGATSCRLKADAKALASLYTPRHILCHAFTDPFYSGLTIRTASLTYFGQQGIQGRLVADRGRLFAGTLSVPLEPMLVPCGSCCPHRCRTLMGQCGNL